MAVNYGITYCKKVLKDLRDIEDKMFEEQGHGFVQFGEQHNTELKYKRLLKQFERERELDLKPTYDPDIHGSEHQ